MTRVRTLLHHGHLIFQIDCRFFVTDFYISSIVVSVYFFISQVIIFTYGICQAYFFYESVNEWTIESVLACKNSVSAFNGGRGTLPSLRALK